MKHAPRSVASLLILLLAAPAGAQAGFNASIVSRARCLGLLLGHVLDEEVVAPKPHWERYEGFAGDAAPDTWTGVRYPGGKPPGHAPKRLRLVKPLGEGNSGTAWQVEVEPSDGGPRWVGVIKATPVQGDYVRYEWSGYVSYRAGIEMARKSGDPEPLSHLVPVHGVIHLRIAGKDMIGYLGEKAGISVADGLDGKLSLDPFDPKQRGPVILRNGMFAHDLLEAFGQMTRAGIAHRDVKPDNLMLHGGSANSVAELDAGGARFALIDHGLVAPLGTLELGLFGTPGYMDPSVFQAHQVHSQSDFYSLGVMLAGHLGDMYPSVEGPHVREIRYPQADGEAIGLPFLDKPFVMSRLKKIFGQLKEADAPAPQRQLFRDLSVIVEIALEPTIEGRIQLAREHGKGLIKLNAQGQVIGAGDVLKAHIRQAEAVSLDDPHL